MIDLDEVKTRSLGVAGGLLLAVVGFRVGAFLIDLLIFLAQLGLSNLGVVRL